MLWVVDASLLLYWLKDYICVLYLRYCYCCYLAVVHCFSGCWCGCCAEWVLSWWRHSEWRQNRVPVTSFTFCRFSRSSTKWSQWIEWTVTSIGLTDKTSCGGTCQQPCCVLHLFDVGSTYESAWSVAQSTTQTHCRVTLYFFLRCHSDSLCQETHLAAVSLPTMFGLLQLCTR